MARMPVPGGDEGTWGDILNDFLAQSHNSDGTLQSTAVPDGSVTPAKLSQAYVSSSEKGASGGVATLDGTGKVPASQLPAGADPVMGGDISGTASNAQIVAGVIVDADVNASAAIAQSKVANLTSDLAGKANVGHTHAIADVTNLQTSLDGKEPSLATGTTSQYYRGDKTWQTLDKSAVGLANVDNTSDANKPISTATQTALDGKADDVHSHAIADTSGLQAALDTKAEWAAVGWVKALVRAATTANITLSGTQTVDSVALNVGDRVLVKNQTTASQNGIYIVAAGAWTRASDFDATPEAVGALVTVDVGSTNGQSIWFFPLMTTGTLGTTNITPVRLTTADGSGSIADIFLPARLQSQASSVIHTDWNNVFTNGFFRSTGNAANAPGVVSGEWTGVTIYANNNMSQIVTGFEFPGPSQVWVRHYDFVSDSWAGWTRMGGALTVQDENGNVATNVTRVDFQGAGVTATNGTGEVVVTIPGGSIKDRRWQTGSGETAVDEFNDSSLDAAWVRVDGANAPAANVTWTEGADVLSALQTATDTGNAFHALLRPIGAAMVAGDAFITCMTLHGIPGTNYSVAGLCVTDGTTYGSGIQVLAESYFDTSSPMGLVNALNHYTNFTGSAAGSLVDKSPAGAKQFMRLVYMGSNQWRFDRSPDGVSWIKGASNLTVASFTPTQVGVISRKPPGTSNHHVASFELLRRVSGIT